MCECRKEPFKSARMRIISFKHNDFFSINSDRLHPVKNQWGEPGWGQVSPYVPGLPQVISVYRHPCFHQSIRHQV